MMNRGTGLLWSLAILRGVEPTEDDDFIRRNYYKCALALGDVLLVAYDRYTTRYTGRDALVAALAEEKPEVGAFGLVELYEAALEFKFTPHKAPEPDLSEAGLLALAERWGRVFSTCRAASHGTGMGIVGQVRGMEGAA